MTQHDQLLPSGNPLRQAFDRAQADGWTGAPGDREAADYLAPTRPATVCTTAPCTQHPHLQDIGVVTLPWCLVCGGSWLTQNEHVCPAEQAAPPRDGEPYREGLRLTGDEVPNGLLARLDAAWPQRKPWHLTTVTTKEFVLDALFSLDLVEKTTLERAAVDLAAAGRSLLTVAELRWSESDSHEPAPPEREFICERPWTRGEPIEWSFLICRMSGLSIPLLTEQA